MRKYRQSVKDNPKSGYDWSATGQWQTAFCVCQREHWECRRSCVQSGRQSKNAPIESWIATVFEIFTLKDRKLLILHTSPLFDAPAQVGTPRNFWMKLSPQKLEGLGYRVVKIS